MTAALSLVADIGGTNTRVALCDAGGLRKDSTRRFRNVAHDGLDAVLRAYLAEAGSPDLHGVCVALAGPVRDGEGRLTNLDWRITTDGLAGATGAVRAALLNDLQAQGHALGRIAAADTRAILDRPAQPGRTQLVVGVGTGFNAAPVHDAPGGRLVAASECGHVSLPVASPEAARLAAWLARRHGFAAVEEALSGRGLEHIDAWLAEEEGAPATGSAAEVMQALENGAPRATRAVQHFVQLLGRVTGDLALVHLPFGGLWLAGGVARSLAPHFERFGFADAFSDKGRFSGFMDQFPVAVIEDDYAALSGCAAFLAEGSA